MNIFHRTIATALLSFSTLRAADNEPIKLRPLP